MKHLKDVEYVFALTYKAFILLISILLLTQCDDSDSELTSNSEPLAEPPSYVAQNSVRSNVVIINPDQIFIKSDDEQISQGLYILEYRNGLANEFKPDDIIVSGEGSGFIRRVISSTNEENVARLNTEEAYLIDVFSGLDLDLDLKKTSDWISSGNTEWDLIDTQIEYKDNRATLNGSTDHVSFPLGFLGKDNGGGEVSLSGRTSYRSSYDMNLKIQDNQYSFFEFIAKDLNIATQGAILIDFTSEEWYAQELPLAKYTEVFRAYVGEVPIVCSFTTEFDLDFYINSDNKIRLSENFSNVRRGSLGVSYDGTNWSTIEELEKSTSTRPVTIASERGSYILKVWPKVTFSMFGNDVASTALSIDQKFNYGRVGGNSRRWYGKMNMGEGMVMKSFSKGFADLIPDFYYSNSSREDVFIAPHTIEIISGNNQEGYKRQTLSEPLTVRVVDTRGNPVINAHIEWSVEQGEGIVSDNATVSDGLGFSSINWEVGIEGENQAKATIHYVQDNQAKTGEVIFVANAIDPEGIVEVIEGFEMVYVGSRSSHIDDFQISKYEVTQAQWRAVMGTSPSHFNGCDDCPVENISRTDAAIFMGRLGHGFRLPSAGELYLASSGGSQYDGFEFAGSNNPNLVSWHYYNSDGRTHPVGLKQPSTLGIYDLSGNVSEMTSTLNRDYIYQNIYLYYAVGGNWTTQDWETLDVSINHDERLYGGNSPKIGLRIARSIP